MPETKERWSTYEDDKALDLKLQGNSWSEIEEKFASNPNCGNRSEKALKSKFQDNKDCYMALELGTELNLENIRKLREKENKMIELENKIIELEDTIKKKIYDNNETFIELNDQVSILKEQISILKEESENKTIEIKKLKLKNEKSEKVNSILIQNTELQDDNRKYIRIRFLNTILLFLILIHIYYDVCMNITDISFDFSQETLSHLFNVTNDYLNETIVFLSSSIFKYN
tara:strand:+ start:50 stop:739 length:690 start_codon:yes stop_codon:yes gene_type:complete